MRPIAVRTVNVVHIPYIHRVGAWCRCGKYTGSIAEVTVVNAVTNVGITAVTRAAGGRCSEGAVVGPGTTFISDYYVVNRDVAASIQRILNRYIDGTRRLITIAIFKGKSRRESPVIFTGILYFKGATYTNNGRKWFAIISKGSKDITSGLSRLKLGVACGDF
jgi:hypothetical protein